MNFSGYSRYITCFFVLLPLFWFKTFLTVIYNRQNLYFPVMGGIEIFIVIVGVRSVLKRTGGRSHYTNYFFSFIEIVFSRMYLS